MHGGAYGVLFGNHCSHIGSDDVLTCQDMFTTIALAPISRPGYYDFIGGVTRNLNISYLRAIPPDTTVLFRARVVQHGKTAALIYGEALTADAKKIYATVEHHKINVPMLKAHKDVRVKWDDDMDRKGYGEQAQKGKL